jgi:plastocyanin
MLRRVFAVGVVLLVAAAPASSRDLRAAAAGGSVRGRVDVQHPLSVSHQPASNPTGPPVVEVRRQAVVYFEEAPADPVPAAPMHARMRQTNETFVPHLLALTVGSTVDFPNDDKTYHNVFSLSKTRRFDLGRYAAGQSKAVVFDKPGIVRVFCDIHSHMNAFILVFAHRFFALTDADGRYRIDQVPPGTYAVTAWYEGIAQETRRVTVAEGGAVDLDFGLRR